MNLSSIYIPTFLLAQESNHPILVQNGTTKANVTNSLETDKFQRKLASLYQKIEFLQRWEPNEYIQGTSGGNEAIEGNSPPRPTSRGGEESLSAP